MSQESTEQEMTGMDEYEKLKELYEHMMAVRKESRQHIQEEGLWFPERQQQAVRDDLQALSQAQDALCQALAQVQIATADKADELGELGIGNRKTARP